MTATLADVEAARAEYRDLWREAAEVDCWCREDHGGPTCGSWMWLDVEAASLLIDNLEAERLSGRHPRLMSREVPLS